MAYYYFINSRYFINEIVRKIIDNDGYKLFGHIGNYDGYKISTDEL
jgi:ATPase subunit of ABC transporter with duplicated ATPase domains